MWKSSKKSNVEVAPAAVAVPPAKSAKKGGKRESDQVITTSTNAKKHKVVVAVPKKNGKKSKKVKAPAKVTNKPAKPTEKEVSSSEESESYDEEIAKKDDPAKKQPSALAANGMQGNAKTEQFNSNAERDSDSEVIMSLGSWRSRRSRSSSRQDTCRQQLLGASIADAADLQSSHQSQLIDTGDSPDYVCQSGRSHDSANILHESSSVSSTSGVKRGRGRSDPCKFLPKEGDPPFLLRILPEGVAVGDNATKWGKYVVEEGSQYQRYPLHKRWDATQEANVVACFDSVQVYRCRGYRRTIYNL